ncbi:hypothetical protein Btru_027237 [Bulinus truncatus]|nr:hypothetical protein Btru_027237 [Bulinus truncatus]
MEFIKTEIQRNVRTCRNIPNFYDIAHSYVNISDSMLAKCIMRCSTLCRLPWCCELLYSTLHCADCHGAVSCSTVLYTVPTAMVLRCSAVLYTVPTAMVL